MLSRLAALLLIAKLVLLANALNTGVSIFAYDDLVCDDSSDGGSISTGNLVTDGTCSSLVRKGPVAFQVANSNKLVTLCQGQSEFGRNGIVVRLTSGSKCISCPWLRREAMQRAACCGW